MLNRVNQIRKGLLWLEVAFFK